MIVDHSSAGIYFFDSFLRAPPKVVSITVNVEIALLFLWQKRGESSVWDSHSIFGKPQKGYLVLQNQGFFLT